MKKSLLEGLDSSVFKKEQRFVEKNSKNFIYQTDDCYTFDTLDEALDYVNGEDGNEANMIVRIQMFNDDSCDVLPESIMWTREDGRLDEKYLKEGTSNFVSMYGLPLYVFYTYDEALYLSDNVADAPKEDEFESEEDYEVARDEFTEKFIDVLSRSATVLGEDEVDELRDSLDDLNREIEVQASEIEDNEDASDEELEQADILRDLATFKLEDGHYSGVQITAEANDEFENLNKTYGQWLMNKLIEIGKKYHLTRLDVSYRFSNGETGYSKVDEAKKKIDIHINKDAGDPDKNTAFFNHTMNSDVCDNETSSDECLAEDKHRDEYEQEQLKKINATEEEIADIIRIADEYELACTKGFITYSEMDKIASELKLKNLSDKNLARMWTLCYNALWAEEFKNSSEDTGKYSDAASAFAEVINREARERKEKGNYDPDKE